MMMKIAILYLIFLMGYWIGKITGMKYGYRNCLRDLLNAKNEERRRIGSSFDDFLYREGINIDEKLVKERLKTLL